MKRYQQLTLSLALAWRLTLGVGALGLGAGSAASDNAQPGVVDRGAQELTNRVDRHYGLLVGDRFNHHVRLSVPEALRLDQASLPKAGRANRWLELVARDITERREGSARLYDIVLHYQVMTSDEVISLAALPRPLLRFVTGAPTAAADATNSTKTITLKLDEQHISVSPITDVEAWNNDGLQTLRPERGTPLLNTLATKQRIAAYLAALALLGAYWLYRIYGIPFLARRRGPFVQAWRRLQHMQGAHAPILRETMRELHRAFDAKAGATVFRDNVDTFLQHHPRYTSLREPIANFFDLSRTRFYALDTESAELNANSKAQLEALHALARRLSLLERGLA